MEHRALWTGFALGLVAIGASGFVGYLVALEFADPPRDFEWSNKAIIGSSVPVVVGVLMLAFVIRAMRSDRKVRLHLNSLLGEGLDLRADLLAESDMTTMPAWEGKAREWASRTFAYLSDKLPEYAALFYVEDEGQRLAFSGNQSFRLTSEWLDRRTARLASILLKV